MVISNGYHLYHILCQHILCNSDLSPAAKKPRQELLQSAHSAKAAADLDEVDDEEDSEEDDSEDDDEMNGLLDGVSFSVSQPPLR